MKKVFKSDLFNVCQINTLLLLSFSSPMLPARLISSRFLPVRYLSAAVSEREARTIHTTVSRSAEKGVFISLLLPRTYC